VTSLHGAATSGSTEACRLLLEYEMDVNARDHVSIACRKTGELMENERKMHENTLESLSLPSIDPTHRKCSNHSHINKPYVVRVVELHCIGQLRLLKLKYVNCYWIMERM
jgi:hypothetical protein